MAINVPQKAKDAMSGSMQTRSAVELPFPCPAFYVINGNPELEALQNSLYFGGWAANNENIKKTTEKWDVPEKIPGMYELKRSKGDKTYFVQSARSIAFAPIGMRMYSSIEVNGVERRVAPFTKGASPGIQVLGILGHKNEQRQLQAWAPVMLTASGYQVSHIQRSFETWRKAIMPHVKKLIPDYTDSVLNLFWMYIGTFGDMAQVPAGPPRRDGQKYITPIRPYVPDDLDEKKVESLFVGEGIANFMADIHEEAKEWLTVFSKMQQAASQQVVHEDATPFDEPPPPEDDIPF
ncbi:MAG: hypothetical protein HY865_22325 [Chloroflexi bacterium]|nr:hypothetical protein [Chloroflexota bacterium]